MMKILREYIRETVLLTESTSIADDIASQLEGSVYGGAAADPEMIWYSFQTLHDVGEISTEELAQKINERLTAVYVNIGTIRNLDFYTAWREFLLRVDRFAGGGINHMIAGDLSFIIMKSVGQGWKEAPKDGTVVLIDGISKKLKERE